MITKLKHILSECELHELHPPSTKLPLHHYELPIHIALSSSIHHPQRYRLFDYFLADSENI